MLCLYIYGQLIHKGNRCTNLEATRFRPFAWSDAMFRIFLQLLVITLIFVPSALSILHVQMRVISGIPNNPNPLRLQCKSGDDDLGMHELKTGEALDWHFGINIFGRTLFFCHFYWGAKDQVFDVFNTHMDIKDCLPSKVKHRDYSCYWLAKPDGFYISNGEKMWKKMHDWPV